MGRASRLKRERREATKQLGLSILPDELKNKKITHQRIKNQKKLSAALIDLVSPFFDHDIELSEYRNLLSAGQFAWNMSVLNNDLDEFMDDENKKASLEMKSFAQDLMHRKNELYPDDDRLIAACDVQLTPNGDFHIVAATAKPETA